MRCVHENVHENAWSEEGLWSLQLLAEDLGAVR